MARCDTRNIDSTVGRWRLTTINDAPIQADAGAMFGDAPRTAWEPLIHGLDRQHRMRLGLNCLLLRNHERCILIDAGMGALRSAETSNAYGMEMSSPTLLDALADVDVAPEEIDMVILTHLHLDHSGWCMRPNPQKPEKAVPTFPRAVHIVQRAEVEAANSDNPHLTGDYCTEDAAPLATAGLLEIIEGEVEIAPGLRLILTAAHSPGHQAVLLNDGGSAMLHPGDIIPTAHHLREGWTSSYDMAPVRVAESKAILLDAAARDDWLVFINHEPEQPLGRVRRQPEGGFAWDPINTPDSPSSQTD